MKNIKENLGKRKRILFLSPYPQGVAPSQRLKYEQYFNVFEREGFEISVSSFVEERFWKIIYKKGFFFRKTIYTIWGYLKRICDLFKLRKFDIVYVHLWVTPLGLPFFEFLVRKLSKSLIYDIDDMIFLGHASDANKMLKILKGKKKIIYLMKHSDHVITSTPALYNFVLQYNKNCTDIPTTIDTSKYRVKKDYSINGRLVLGYSGSHSTAKYLKSIEKVFELLMEEKIPFVVRVIGDENFKFDNSAIPLEKKQWRVESEEEDLLSFDIGLYPLTDEPWIYGKRGAKALLYMAVGIPAIASAIGTNNETYIDGENGFLVPIGSNELWVKYIKMLYENPQLRESIGKCARKIVEEKFSVEVYKQEYLNILRKYV